MKLNIINISKTEIGKLEMPGQFSEEIRPDLIKQAVLVIRANRRQPYGASPEAGKRASAELSRRRNKYRGSYGHGISRVPRKIMSRRGTRFNWVGAFAPGTVGGRRAHPPKAEKSWKRKMNIKERRKAIRSALAATLYKKIVSDHGHVVPADYPFIIEKKLESVEKSKDLLNILQKMGFSEELKRVSLRSIRAGKGKMRGRKYRTKTGPLIVVSEACNLSRAGKNLPGIDIVKVDKLNAEHLAPGAIPGRLTLFTEAALAKMGADMLFFTKPRRVLKKEAGAEKNKAGKKGRVKPEKQARPVKKADSQPEDKEKVAV